AHAFAYTAVDLEQTYDPPTIGLPTDTTQYTYNLDRQLTLVTRPDGQTLTLGYEPTGGRLSSLTLPGSQTIAYAYHATTGNLSTITAPGSTLSYSYDGSLLTTTTWTGTVQGSVSRNYDNNFRISSQSVNGGNTISFGYDNDSLLTSAGALTITRSSQHSLITGTTLGAVTDSRSYSSFGELSSYTANVSGSPVLSVTSTRDKLGRITQKVETIGGQTETFDYLYDLAGRLTQVKKNGTVVASYLYDSNGNRLSRTTPAGTTLGFYDAQDRLTQHGTTTSAYTANGELQSSTVGGQTTTYHYDVLGNLKSVVGPTGFTIEYLVDGQNRRIGKKVNGVLVQGFLYQNQLNPVAELDGSGAVVSRFVYGTKANVPDYMIKGGITYRMVSDHLGSPRLVVNTADGTVAQRMDFDEFGNIITDTAPGFQPFGFAGGLSDQHTGLVRFGARDYDALTGRWAAKDPLRFLGLDPNLYGYVENSPVNLIDPPGLWGFGGIAGGTAEAGDAAGFGFQASSGAGFFWGGSAGLNSGGFTSRGSFVGSPKDDNPKPFVFGATAGLGGGVFFTNAKCAKQLLGPFDTWSVNLPVISFQFATDGRTRIGSIQIGRSLGFSFSRYKVTTETASGPACDCQ
ncbi:MAG: RHS repeat domain-containing protein, partial [Nitrospiraceae bacterium]